MVTHAALRLIAFLGGVAIAVGGASGASAHAFMLKANPRVGSQVAASPSEVRMWFSEKLEPRFTSVTISGAADQPMHEGTMRVEGPDQQQLVLPIPAALAPGKYHVRWKVVSADSHATKGDFTFSVGR
ncbi:MAG TPA: copper resistance protein CopC [Caulobacteraceae bacterium]